MPALERSPADLVFFNRQLPDLAAGELARALEQMRRCGPAFGYRVFSSSDELFICAARASPAAIISGRRSPQQLLEPIGECLPGASPGEWQAAVCSYVSKLFRFPLPQEEEGPSRLTGREHDILTYLCQGRTDKRHRARPEHQRLDGPYALKKIYEKLVGDSRTEAVIGEYLQK